MEVLEAAERWSVPPWTLLDTAPDIWMERAAIWAGAKNERWSKANKPKVGEWVQHGNKRTKRLI